jgi:glyoxylase-like metal-dependent hydrolase (beta-lactamase superfamily II)
MPQVAAAFLVVEGDRAAFVENNTAHALPLLMDALDARGLLPDQVDYAIITHLHLDHAGGTSALLKSCPNAVVIAHPRAARHLIDPSRLIASAKGVYGGQMFEEQYGTIEPVEAVRIRTVEDGETLDFLNRTFTFIHALGHAKHHICIHDSGSNGVFAGDAFGLAFPSLQRGTKPLVFCSSAPADFDPAEARKSVEKILSTGAERVYVTHFGEVTAVREAAEQLLRSIDSLETILNEAVATDLDGDELVTFCAERVRAAFTEQAANCGIELTDADWQPLANEAFLNAQGIAYAAMKRASR